MLRQVRIVIGPWAGVPVGQQKQTVRVGAVIAGHDVYDGQAFAGVCSYLTFLHYNGVWVETAQFVFEPGRADFMTA